MGRKITQPTEYPVTLEQAQDQVQDPDQQSESYLEELIADATNDIQDIVKRQCLQATCVQTLDCFPWERTIYLYRPPLISVTEVKYLDTGGTPQTFPATQYDVDTSNLAVGRIVLKEGVSWPSTKPDANAVEITYVIGYGANREDVPSNLRRAILLRVEDLYEGPQARGSAFIYPNEQAIERLLAPFEIVEYA